VATASARTVGLACALGALTVAAAIGLLTVASGSWPVPELALAVGGLLALALPLAGAEAGAPLSVALLAASVVVAGVPGWAAPAAFAGCLLAGELAVAARRLGEPSAVEPALVRRLAAGLVLLAAGSATGAAIPLAAAAIGPVGGVAVVVLGSAAVIALVLLLRDAAVGRG
jgi:hypothetical protein